MLPRKGYGRPNTSIDEDITQLMELADTLAKALQNRCRDHIVTHNVTGIQERCYTLHNSAWQVTSNCGKVYLIHAESNMYSRQYIKQTPHLH